MLNYVTKTVKAFLFSNNLNVKLKKYIDVIIGETEIPESNRASFLDVTVDSHLKWDAILTP